MADTVSGLCHFKKLLQASVGNGLGGGYLDLPKTLSLIAEIDMLYDARQSHHRYNLLTSVGHMTWRDQQLEFHGCL